VGGGGEESEADDGGDGSQDYCSTCGAEATKKMTLLAVAVEHVDAIIYGETDEDGDGEEVGEIEFDMEEGHDLGEPEEAEEDGEHGDKGITPATEVDHKYNEYHD